jgi:hypothetical protein
MHNTPKAPSKRSKRAFVRYRDITLSQRGLWVREAASTLVSTRGAKGRIWRYAAVDSNRTTRHTITEYETGHFTASTGHKRFAFTTNANLLYCHLNSSEYKHTSTFHRLALLVLVVVPVVL